MLMNKTSICCTLLVFFCLQLFGQQELNDSERLKERNPGPGVYLSVKAYFPKLPDKIPEGIKPGDYLRSLNLHDNLDDLEFTPTEKNLYIFISEKALGNYSNNAFDKGKRFSVPIQVSAINEKENKSFNIQGAFLFEVAEKFTSLQNLTTSHPDAAPGDSKNLNLMEFVGTEALLKKSDETSEGKMNITGGPPQEGWSEEAIKENINLIISIYDAVCFVATVVYESNTAPQLNTLRHYRDTVMRNTPAGRRLITIYYAYGPNWARYIKAHSYLSYAIKPVLSVFVILLDHVNLENPYVLAMFNGIHSVVDWIISPFFEETAPEPLTPW